MTNRKVALIIALITAFSAFAGIAQADPFSKFMQKFCHFENLNWQEIIDEIVYDKEFEGSLEAAMAKYSRRFGKCNSYHMAEKGSTDGIVQKFISINYNDAVVVLRVTALKNGIGGFWEEGIKIKNDSFDKITNELADLPGRVSVAVQDEKKKLIFTHNPDEILALGSTFKLFVLKALKDKISEGKISWFDIVELKEDLKSHPSGVLQDWIAGTPLTIETLATLMISISDNTATDMLIDFLGREEIEKYTPNNRPFLKTKEMFFIKYAVSEGLRQKYLAGDKYTRRRILDGLSSRNLPTLKANFNEPHFIDKIEWFASTKEVADLALSLKGEEILTIKPWGNKGQK